MSEDIPNKVDEIVTIIDTDEDGPEEGEIQDDSSDEEVCPVENDAFKSKSAYYGSSLEVAATECSRANPVNGAISGDIVRIGYPACVQDVYREVPWTEKVEGYETFPGSSRSHPRKGVKGADYQFEKENHSKYFKSLRSPRRLRSSESVSTEQNTAKKHVNSRSGTLRTPSNSRRKLSRATIKTHIHTARENYRKRRHSVEERRRHSNISDRTKNPIKKATVNKIPSDLEVQIQKTKKRFQNKDAIINTIKLPEINIKNEETGDLSSFEVQDLNESSTCIKILEVSPNCKNGEETIITIDINSRIDSENIKVSKDDNKEELNLRLIALKSAIQAKYGKGKNLKGKQKQNEVSKEQQDLKHIEAVDIDVEPVDMDLSITDDEKEVSDIPVIINTNATSQADYLMFATPLETHNWNHVVPEMPVHTEENNRFIILDEVANSPTSLYFPEPVKEINDTVNSAVSYSDNSPLTCIQNVDTIPDNSIHNVYQPIQDMELPLAQLSNFENNDSNILALTMQNSGVEEDDEELLRAQLLIAISNKQNSGPQTNAVDSVNELTMLPPSKPNEFAVKKQPEIAFKGSKLGSKLILKEIYKNKKTQKLAKNYKRQLKEVKRKPALATSRALPGNTHLATAAASSKEVRAAAQSAGSVARLVICLGEDTETEDESEPTKVSESKTESAQIASANVQSKLVKNVDQFLKQVRQNVEQQQQQPKSKSTNIKQMDVDPSLDNKSDNETVPHVSVDAFVNNKSSKETSVETEQQLLPHSTASEDLTRDTKLILKKVQTRDMKSNIPDTRVAMTKTLKVPEDAISIDKTSLVPKQIKKMTNKSPYVAANKELAASKKLVPKSPVSSKTKIVSKVGTLSALSHLPSSQQVEYRRLKLEIARREELRKLKMRLGQPVAKNIKDKEISLLEQPKLEITVSNRVTGGEEAATERTVRQADSEDDTHLISITENSEILEKSCNDNVPESDKNKECKYSDDDLDKSEKNEKIKKQNDFSYETNSDVKSAVQQQEAMAKLTEGNVLTSENKKRVSLTSKRKSAEPDVITKRAKCNIEQDEKLFNLDIKLDIMQQAEIKIIPGQVQNISRIKNASTDEINDLEELPGLSISLSQNGRNVEEIKMSTKKDTPLIEANITSKNNGASKSCKRCDDPNDPLIACDSQVQELSSSSSSPKLLKSIHTKKTIIRTTKVRKQQVKANKKNNSVKKEKLHSAEKELLVNRQELLQQLKNLESLLEQVEHKQAQMADAEARVEALRRELVRAEIRAEEERIVVKKLFNQVGQVRVEVAKTRTQCAGLSKTCQRLGHDAEGLTYHVPLDGADELKTHLQHVVELTQKTRKTRQFPQTTPLSNTSPDPPVLALSITAEPGCIELAQQIDLNSDVAKILNHNSNLEKTGFPNSNALKCKETVLTFVDNIQTKNNDCIKDSNDQKYCVDQVEANIDAETTKLIHTCNSPVKSDTCQNSNSYDAFNCDFNYCKIVSEAETPTNEPTKSFAILPEQLPLSSSNAAGLALSLKPYKSPLEHMKPRGGTQQQTDALFVSMDPNKVMCPYALTGRCLDDECTFLHPYTNQQ